MASGVLKPIRKLHREQTSETLPVVISGSHFLEVVHQAGCEGRLQWWYGSKCMEGSIRGEWCHRLRHGPIRLDESVVLGIQSSSGGLQ